MAKAKKKKRTRTPWKQEALHYRRLADLCSRDHTGLTTELNTARAQLAKLRESIADLNNREATLLSYNKNITQKCTELLERAKASERDYAVLQSHHDDCLNELRVLRQRIANIYSPKRNSLYRLLLSCANGKSPSGE